MRLTTKKLLDYYVGGILLLFLRPLVRAAGKALRRDHDPVVRGDICIFKLLGGGSLLIAFPALLGIRRRYPEAKITLITTRETAPIAQTLGDVFDRVLMIDDSSPFRCALTTLKVLTRAWRTDTVIDFEVYSQLTTVLSVLTLARNRIGFYLESAFFREWVHTHLIFFNRFSGSHFFYNEVARLLDASPAPFSQCRTNFRQTLGIEGMTGGSEGTHLVIGHACSELVRERMLTADQWGIVFCENVDRKCRAFVSFLGGKDDANFADQIIERIASTHPKLVFHNLCGRSKIQESVRVLATATLFLGIDSALLHFARLLGVRNISFWGPTHPSTRLQFVEGLEELALYHKIPCSPCVHVAETPPCRGEAACVKSLFQAERIQHLNLARDIKTLHSTEGWFGISHLELLREATRCSP